MRRRRAIATMEFWNTDRSTRSNDADDWRIFDCCRSIDRSIEARRSARVGDNASSDAHASLGVSPLRGANSRPHFVHHCVKWIGWRKKKLSSIYPLTRYRFHCLFIFIYLLTCLFIHLFCFCFLLPSAKRSLSRERVSINFRQQCSFNERICGLKFARDNFRKYSDP